MESGLDARLQKRNEAIKTAADDAKLPLKDLQKLKIHETQKGEHEKIYTIEGQINGVELKITKEDYGTRTLAAVSLNGNELRGNEKMRVLQAIDHYLQREDTANLRHIDEVYEEARAVNQEFDRQHDPYNVNVLPLVDKLFGGE